MDCSDVILSRKQAKQLCFAIIADISNYCEEHKSEFEEFLRAEELTEKGVQKK